MAINRANPHPSRTVWGIVGLVIFLIVLVGYLAATSGNLGFAKVQDSGGMMPALFVGIAAVVGAVSVGLFIHRSSR